MILKGRGSSYLACVKVFPDVVQVKEPVLTFVERDLWGCMYVGGSTLDSLTSPILRGRDWSTPYHRVVLITEIGNDQSRYRSNVM